MREKNILERIIKIQHFPYINMIVKCAPSIRNRTENGTVSFLECQGQLRLTKNSVKKKINVHP